MAKRYLWPTETIYTVSSSLRPNPGETIILL